MTPCEVLSNTLAFKQSPTCFIVSSDSTPLDIVELWSLTLDQRCCSRTATGSLLSASRPHVGLVCCSESPTSIRKRLRNESAPPLPTREHNDTSDWWISLSKKHFVRGRVTRRTWDEQRVGGGGAADRRFSAAIFAVDVALVCCMLCTFLADFVKDVESIFQRHKDWMLTFISSTQLFSFFNVKVLWKQFILSWM